MARLAIASREISPHVWHHWRPRPQVKSWEWVCEHIREPKGGDRFQADDYPWLRGVCDAFDRPQVREIDLMWATRLGKTFIGQCLMLNTMANNPMPGLFASSVQKLALDNVRSKLYPMLEYCRPLCGQLKSKAKRSMFRLELRDCLWKVGWSGSDSSLADFGAWMLHCSEVDKWDDAKSDEADPVELAAERCKEFPDHKMIFEGTPKREGKSRIAAKLSASTNCRYYVPCPYCHHRQVLRFALNEEWRFDRSQGGILWDGLDRNQYDPDLAYTTSRYLCGGCQREIHDEQRKRMMGHGEWVAEGQSIDKQGRVQGVPRRGGEAWGSQLSSLYSMQLRWGNCGRVCARALARPHMRHNLMNSWLGLPYSPHRAQLEPEQLGERLRTEYALQLVPAWVRLLSASVDVQDTFFVVHVWGWGGRERGHQVDYQICDTWDDVLGVLDRRYEIEGARETMGIPITLVDSSAFTLDVYKFCKKNSLPYRLIIPCKGASGDMGGEAYKKTIVGVKKGRKLSKAALRARGLLRIQINVDYWESELQDALDTHLPGGPASLSLSAEASHDMDLCMQLLNGTRSDRRNKREVDEYLWVKRWPDDPNDHRDCVRMARVAAELIVRGNWAGLRERRLALPPTPQPATPAEQKAPDRKAGGFVRTPRRDRGAPFVRRLPRRRT